MAYLGNKKILFAPSITINSYEEGYNAGYQNGYNDGGTNGYQAGESDGRRNAWAEFWDNHQQNGNKTNYTGAFFGWHTANFKPEYNIIPTSCNRMFCMFGYGETPFDFRKLVEDAGIVLDFSQSQNMGYAFNMCYAKTVGVIDLSAATTAEFLFAYASRLETIEEIIFDGWCKLESAFLGATALKNITITGVLPAQKGINFSHSTLLTHDSLMSIINALEDVMAWGTGENYTLSIGKTNIAKLTDDEICIATSKGWTLA